jgi:hypothetical protein
LTVRTGGLTAFGVRTGLDDLEAVRAEVRDGDVPEGRRRSVWALFFAVRAGLRAEVRDLVTRRDFAICGILANQLGPEGTVTNRVVYGQDPKPYSTNPPILGQLTTIWFRIQEPVEFIDRQAVALRQYFECLTSSRTLYIGQFTKFVP